ncbi:hypothetical protein H310_00399 [Aphanomyces invadans]|uniref:Uncharacterized protein n=1 Tax=Aphanomyces invadans TaxID=157072 RepID=A0A024UWH1_9STRA|nr:hypothetical protein H310_00399 [Aphanomyces invadans]ETW09988.1 hypothetical protein H310_00399 [Aphanomyces invadans]|eukprot:XP_008861399.1 hypothetical protein H310_00399 [Aphanomyces invadans]
MFPTIGVSCAFLVAWKDSHVASGRFPPSATTSDVCAAVVQPDTANTNCSYAQLLAPTAAPGSIGRATHFVSHAWKYSFCDLVAAIEIYFLSLPPPESKDGVFFWIDLFVVDQHNAPARPHSWWSTTFVDAIRTIGKVVLVFQPFLDPIPLKRAWCLWEVFAALQTRAAIDVAMPTEQWTDYRVSLRENYRNVIDTLQALDARHAEAFNPNDKDEIFRAIEQGVGFDGLNTRVRQLVAGILLVGVTRHSCQDANLQRLTDMLDLGPDINTVSTFLTPLGVASDMNSPLVVDFLLARGADVNAIMAWGHTALHVACRAGHADIVRLLLLAGANPSLRNTAGRTPHEEATYMASNPIPAVGTPTTTRTEAHPVSPMAEVPAALVQAMEAAHNAMNSLTKCSISELKSIHKPPERCAWVMKCLVLILGFPGPSDPANLTEWWEIGKRKLLSNPNVLDTLVDGCDFPSILTSTTAPNNDVLALLADPALDLQSVGNTSQAMWAFYLWARCYLVAHQVKAQRTDLEHVAHSVQDDLKRAKDIQAAHINNCLQCAAIVHEHLQHVEAVPPDGVVTTASLLDASPETAAALLNAAV